MRILVTGGCGFTRPPRQRAKFYYTYVLESLKDRKLYIGWTNNLEQRIKEHQTGKVFSTKYRLPVKLIYYEACLSKEAAIKREKYFKTGFGRRFLRSRLAGSRPSAIARHERAGGGRVGSR